MARIYRFLKKLWQQPGFRLLLAATFAACVGIAASDAFIGSVVVVEGNSMTPNYEPGAHLYAAPISTPLERGDVVLLNDGMKDYAVKRIVGLPGETVHLWRGSVFINRKVLIEPYLLPHTYTFPIEPARRGAAFILGEKQYLVLGDNRPYSADSRTYGPVQRKQIKKRDPLPDNFVPAYLGAYALPEYGKTIMRPLHKQQAAPSPF